MSVHVKIQFLSHTNGCNKYCNKHCAKLDKNNLVIVNSRHNDPHMLVNQAQFLHNTKIVRSAMNESKAIAKKRNKNHPRGKVIAITEMIHKIIREDEVNTDMNHIGISSLLLEHRYGYYTTKDRKYYTSRDMDDSDDVDFFCFRIRESMNLDMWRRHSENERLILKGVRSSHISVDRVSLFSIRPPELRDLIDQPSIYFRWFHIRKKSLNFDEIEEKINTNLYSCTWIDAIQHQIYLWDKAFEEMENNISSNDFLNHKNTSIKLCAQLIRYIIELDYLANDNSPPDEESTQDWKHISIIFMHRGKNQHLPVPVFSFVKPSHNIKFILHILLSLCHYNTEVALLTKPSLRDSMTYAKLIGDSCDPDDLQQYFDSLLQLFITKQLKSYPCSYSQMVRYVNLAGELFNSIIVRNEIPITNMPPSLQTSLDSIYEDSIRIILEDMKSTLIHAAFTEIGDSI